jgi:hypothetical protein
MIATIKMSGFRARQIGNTFPFHDLAKQKTQSGGICTAYVQGMHTYRQLHL